jgi:hypothetical protein
MIAPPAFDAIPPALTGLVRWLLWREEKRRNTKTGEVTKTKPPIAFRTGKKCNAGDFHNWAGFEQVRKAIERAPGTWDGIGFALGENVGSDELFIGLDADTCIDGDGTVADWAMQFLVAMNSYSEISPGEHGVKSVARIRVADLPLARRLLGIPEGDRDQARTRTFGPRPANGGHPPGAQLFLTRRFFTVTGRHWAPSPTEVRLLTIEQIALLGTLFGAAPQAGKPTAAPGKLPEANGEDVAEDDETAPDLTALRSKLAQALRRVPELRKRWNGDASGMKDTTRTAMDMSVGRMLKLLGFTYAEMRAALLDYEYGATEKRDERYFRRIWKNTTAQALLPPAADLNISDEPPDIGPKTKPPPVAEEIACLELPAITEFSQIPPRRWAYGRFLMLGAASVLGAMDGTGKGFVTVPHILSIVTGRPLLGERVWRSGSVGIITYEDDANEWLRRIAAACIHYQVDYEDVRPHIFFLHRPGGRIVFAQRVASGETLYPDSAAIIAQLRARKAVTLIVDPFNSAHLMDDGNSNVQIVRVAMEITRIAQLADVAALVLHHLRKGSTGEPDDLMGAVALRANFRCCRILRIMTENEAESLRIVDERFRHLRISSGKENYAPRATQAIWFKLLSLDLGNGTADYPEGDSVAVATSWKVPSPFAGMSWEAIEIILAAIRDGPGGGERYSPNRQAKKTWAGHLIIEHGNRTEAQAADILDAWIKSGLLVVADYYNQNRNTVAGLSVNEAIAASMTRDQGDWQDD